MDAEAGLQLLVDASIELREVDVGSAVDRVHVKDLPPLRFATQYVARNKPVIITGSLEQWPALKRWSSAYLCRKAGAALVTVDLTPSGRGDAVAAVTAPQQLAAHMQQPQRQEQQEQPQPPPQQQQEKEPEQQEDGAEQQPGEPRPGGQQAAACVVAPPPSPSQQWFVTPAEWRMTCRQFFALLRDSRGSAGATRLVPYVQHQNSSLSQEWAFLDRDIQPHLSWADQVFGGPPDATNLWIGDERSVTSCHKDHYENMYAVVRGTKVFHLLPPSDLFRLHLRPYPAAQYELQPSSAAVSGVSHTQPAQQQQQQQPGGQGAEGGGSLGSQTPLVGRCRLVPVLRRPAQQVVWSPVDLALPPTPLTPTEPCAAAPPRSLLQHPGLSGPLVARVGPGELLYLPALWYHQVSQQPAGPGGRPGGGGQGGGCGGKAGPGEGRGEASAAQDDDGEDDDGDDDDDVVMAVNFWYDMAFDSRWAQYRLLESLATRLHLAQGLPAGS